MLSIDPSTLTERENYKLLIGSIIPRPIAFVTTLSEAGILNGAPFSYFNIVSSDPPLISLSVQRDEGQRKDTARNIIALKEFVIHIVDESNVYKVNRTAQRVPHHQSEVAIARLNAVRSAHISVPGVKEAKVRMECRLERVVDLGDPDGHGCDLIIGRIVHYHIADEIYDNGKIDPLALAAVSRLAGSTYAKIGELFSLARPK